jgi:hypothetical protein
VAAESRPPDGLVVHSNNTVFFSFLINAFSESSHRLTVSALFCVQVKSVGQVLFMEVVQKLNLLEYDYFDLQFFDIHGTPVSKCFFFMTQALLLHDSVSMP